MTSYTVQFYGQTSQTLTVRPRGRQRGIRSHLDSPYGDFMVVTSTSADGWVSQNSFWNYQVDTSPTVSSDVYLENQTSGGAGVPGP